MATKEDILEVLATQTGPVSPSEIGKELGLDVSVFNNQLKRMANEDPPLVRKDEDGRYIITDDGTKRIRPATEESEGMTEFQKFRDIGNRIGVKKEIVDLTAEHIWRAGNYRDIKWVYEGLTQQDIRKDLRDRWWHTWRGYLQQPIPTELEVMLGIVKPEGTEGEKGKESATHKVHKRDYIIGSSETPIYVGEGLGDLDYDDAMAITKLRLAGQAKTMALGGTSQPQTVGSIADEFIKVVGAVDQVRGGQPSSNKSFVVTPGEKGYEVQELEANKPLIISSPQTANRSPVYYVDADGKVTETQPGQPIVVIKQAPPQTLPAPASTVYVDADGKVQIAKPGEPIVIVREGGRTASSSMQLPVGPEGALVPVSLEQMELFFKAEDWKDERRRKEEKHEVQMDIGKGLRDLVVKAQRAVGHVGGD